MKSLIVLLLIVPLAWANAERGITQEPTQEPSYDATTGKKASLVPPPTIQKPPLFPPGSRTDYPACADSAWVPIDSFAFEQLIPDSERFAIYFDYATETLGDTLVPDFKLTPEIESAIAKAPDWLKWDLTDKFSRISSTLQTTYANLIINCPDSRYRDEVCFQIAHLSKQTLTILNPQLLIVNAEWIYKIAPDLKYVALVEYGDPAEGGNYYTTTKYRILRGGYPIWVEIPREIYYWWIVEPRCSDEKPLIDASVYDKFWREYLYTYADPNYPLLKDVLAPVTILWDEEKHIWNNTDQDFGDSLMAVQAVGRWVAHTLPKSASGNRPIQPNQLLRDHDGNCGECQDLLCAGMRTALIPNISVMDINEDHVWNEVPWNGEFYENQIDLGGGVTHIADSGSAYDQDRGGSKECSCIWDWRGDGYQFSSIERYSQTCTLTVSVVDKNGNPIDGVNVNIDSKPWDAYPEIYGKGFGGATDRNGMFTTIVGDSQDYRVTLQSSFETKGLGWVIDSANCVAGAHFYIVDTLQTAEMPQLDISPKTYPAQPDESYKVIIDYELPYQTIYGKEYTVGSYSNIYAYNKTPGATTFFITDPENQSRYVGDNSFQAYEIREDSSGQVSFVVPTQENYYCVFANEKATVVSEFVKGTAVLYKNSLAPVAEKLSTAPKPMVLLGSYPNPSRQIIQFRYRLSQPGKVQFKIYDLKGDLVKTIAGEAHETGEHIVTWECRDIPAGIYFYTCQHDGTPAIVKQAKLILLK